ncbi:MAG: hypothetical protein IPK82_26180 [Polyangiaceae bacterium]|nr:hypothetical protein [Polyangiaceae bacterium]
MNARHTKILLASVVAASLGCSPAPTARKALPGLPLAESLGAQAAFRPLLKRWSAALTREERTLVAQDVRKFLAKYPNDGQGPAAEALLAWSAVEWGDLVSGRRLSRGAQNHGPGSWQDFTFLIDGAIKRRNGDAVGALKILEPLVSTLIDAWARDLLNEEVIAAAIRAEKPALAVRTMSVWLREAGDEERLLVRARVERALKTVGDADLIKIFDERTARGGGSTENALDLLLVERIAKSPSTRAMRCSPKNSSPQAALFSEAAVMTSPASPPVPRQFALMRAPSVCFFRFETPTREGAAPKLPRASRGASNSPAPVRASLFATTPASLKTPKMRSPNWAATVPP